MVMGHDMCMQGVVGWFSYRRNSSHRVSMRERSVHTKLAPCFTHLSQQGEWVWSVLSVYCGQCFVLCLDFLLALITEQVLDMSTICSTEYSFQYWDRK